MLFQYFSDLHLEAHANEPDFVNSLRLVAKAPYLIIAGDLGNPRRANYCQFLQRASLAFRYVFLISGNHEYYRDIGKKRHSGRKWLSDVENAIRFAVRRFPNVIYLQDAAFRIPNSDIFVYGATLWSNVASEEEKDVARIVDDYQYIPGFTVALSRELFRSSEAGIKAFLEANRGERVVVVTHHLPSRELIHPRYEFSTVRSAYASDIDLRPYPNVASWVAGHTHDAAVERGVYHLNPIGEVVTIEADLCKTFSV